LTAAAAEPVLLAQPLCCLRARACRSVFERNIEYDESFLYRPRGCREESVGESVGLGGERFLYSEDSG
jgi:hypothetical protein